MTVIQIASEAGERWLERRAIREPKQEMIKAGHAIDAESPQRVQLRLQRLTEAAHQSAVAKASSISRSGGELGNVPTLVESIGLERIIGKDDFLNINFLELALAVSRYVGRINIRSSPGRTIGFGTGFMVSPRLLLTNNHVLGKPADAVSSEVEFDYQNDRNGRLLPVVTFGLDPQAFFLTDKELDYTLVAVKELSVTGIEVRRYGWSRLIGSQGKAIMGESLNIIQHPNGEPKQLVLRANQLVDLFDQYAHYVTDTEPGSSGSPVYNDQWELVALHHSGVPKKDDRGNLIANDGSIWHPGMSPDDLAWVANEGIRVSSLVDHIKQQPLTGTSQERMRDDLLNLEPVGPIEAAMIAGGQQDHPAASPAPNPEKQWPKGEPRTPLPRASQTWTIPLQVTVNFGSPLMAQENLLHEPDRLPPGRKIDKNRSDQALEPTPIAKAPEEKAALAQLEAAKLREYYNAAKDNRGRDGYYKNILSTLTTSTDLYTQLHELLKNTHTKPLSYQPATRLYPWVDLQEAEPKPTLRSIYSGKTFDPREFIEADFATDRKREQLRESMMKEVAVTGVAEQLQIDLLEAGLPYNCEHVVPQSWFGKREPMRGDLHHLFACESGCNSFRGNIPYFDFPDYEEALRSDCGKREQGGFEPTSGKGPIARATLYFLLRYPKEINRTKKEYTEDRIRMLLGWHEQFKVTRYERHRNAAIFEMQGNRNPLIDYPEWAGKINFLQGLG